MPKRLEGNVPKEGHLALLTGFQEAISIPKGAQLMIIADPNDVSKAIPVILYKVTRDKISFKCGCRNPQCTRMMDYVLRASGHHPFQTVATPNE